MLLGLFGAWPRYGGIIQDLWTVMGDCLSQHPRKPQGHFFHSGVSPQFRHQKKRPGSWNSWARWKIYPTGKANHLKLTGSLLDLTASWFFFGPQAQKALKDTARQLLLLQKCKVSLMWFLFSSWWWWQEDLSNSFVPCMNFKAGREMDPSSAILHSPKQLSKQYRGISKKN